MSRKTNARSHGEGSINRSDYIRPGSGVTVERWIASVGLGVGPDGKRLRKKVTGPTRKAVADKLRELQREQDAKVDLRKKSMTVAGLAHELLEHLENNEGTKEEGAILRLRPRVTNHIIPTNRIGGHQLDQLADCPDRAFGARDQADPITGISSNIRVIPAPHSGRAGGRNRALEPLARSAHTGHFVRSVHGRPGVACAA